MGNGLIIAAAAVALLVGFGAGFGGGWAAKNAQGSGSSAPTPAASSVSGTPPFYPQETYEGTPYDPTMSYTMFVQQASAATFSKLERLAAGNNSIYSKLPNFKLSLSGVSPFTLVFQDRPDRQSYSERTGRFINGFAFGVNNPPNAALTAAIESPDGNITQQVFVITLARPIYNNVTNTLDYTVTVLNDFSQYRLLDRMIGIQENEIIGAYEVDKLIESNKTIELVSLFIDSCANYNPDCEYPPCGGWNKEFVNAQGGHCNSGIPQSCGKLASSSLGLSPLGMCYQCSYCQPCNPAANGYTYATNCGGSGKNCIGINQETNGCYQQLAELCNNAYYDCCNNPGGGSYCPVDPPPEFGLTIPGRRKMLQTGIIDYTYNSGGGGCMVGCYAE